MSLFLIYRLDAADFNRQFSPQSQRQTESNHLKMGHPMSKNPMNHMLPSPPPVPDGLHAKGPTHFSPAGGRVSVKQWMTEPWEQWLFLCIRHFAGHQILTRVYPATTQGMQLAMQQKVKARWCDTITLELVQQNCSAYQFVTELRFAYSKQCKND